MLWQECIQYYRHSSTQLMYYKWNLKLDTRFQIYGVLYQDQKSMVVLLTVNVAQWSVYVQFEVTTHVEGITHVEGTTHVEVITHVDHNSQCTPNCSIMP